MGSDTIVTNELGQLTIDEAVAMQLPEDCRAMPTKLLGDHSGSDAGLAPPLDLATLVQTKLMRRGVSWAISCMR